MFVAERAIVDTERRHRAGSSGLPRSIAIDGPVAAGKSAVGRLVARRLGYRFIDTGLMYRAVTWLALERGVDPNDEEALTRLAEGADISLEAGPPDAPETAVVRVNRQSPTSAQLRATEAGGVLSLISRVRGVRAAMVALQRKLAREGGVVMAGRDIGTVVLPDTPLKVYLDASTEERVRRRHEEVVAMGQDATPQQVRDELALRDAIDSGRDVSPLRPAKDAVVINTDGLSLDEVVERILKLVPCS